MRDCCVGARITVLLLFSTSKRREEIGEKNAVLWEKCPLLCCLMCAGGTGDSTIPVFNLALLAEPG